MCASVHHGVHCMCVCVCVCVCVSAHVCVCLCASACVRVCIVRMCCAYLWTQLFFDGCTNSSLTYRYSVTCVCKYFETVQHCDGTTTASLKMGWVANGHSKHKALWQLTKNHTMPWCFLLFSNSTVENFVPQGILSLRNKSQSYFVAILSIEHCRFDVRLFGLVGTFPHGLFSDAVECECT